ncbi:hypothetical protein O6H91_22G062000 [Diphasiastrum complanatum]|uniref:Uncharacterized protein n=1 Tax=Diphasiastrum complanatum TaxID=34168 RepID=A0ACC2AGF8_DIPCM|nr:hypothetical protein O6H91_22G062000 [Diphasiastrum complanatum]
MELGQSSELNDEGGGAEEEQQQLEDWFPLGDLPQDCLVRILSQLMPRYVCRVALVSWAFSRVSRLDAIWEHLLPPQYQAILAQAYGGPPQFSSKRELYDCLCQQILLKDGNEVAFHPLLC